MPELTGRQRAAAVLAQLDEGRAARVLAKLSEVEAIALMTEVARLPALDQAALDAVVEDLRQHLGTLAAANGGEEVAMAFLTARFGAERAAEIMEEMRTAGRPRPFAFLSAVEPARLALFLDGEHPQLIVAVLTQLRREQAARVLDALPPTTRTEVARRIVTMGGLSHDAAERLRRELEARLLSIATAKSEAIAADGMDTIVGILTRVEQGTERRVLEQLEEESPELAEEIRSRLFVFENLLALDSRTLQEVLRELDPDTLVLALKGKPPEVVERFAAELTARRAEQLREDLAAMPPQHLRAVQDAEATLVRTTLALDEAGVITLNRADDPMLS